VRAGLRARPRPFDTVPPTCQPLLLLLLVLCVAAVVPASAASLGGLAPDDLTAGQATVAACDDALSVSYATQGGNVTSVTVSGIADPGCEGEYLALRALDSSGASISGAGPAAVPTDADTADNSVTLSLSAQPNAELVSVTAISITGP
jgi:hypothetical protein